MDPDKVDRQLRTLRRFVSVHCKAHHDSGREQCDECTDLPACARSRLAACPLDPKPKCKDCRVHCHRPEHRDKIRKVMRFSGMHFVKRGRIDWLVRHFLTRG